MSIELDDLEARLREMYAAVAADTVVDDPGDADVHPLATGPSPAPRRRPLVAVAAVALLAVMIAAVAVLVARRGDGAPAGAMDGRPFAIPLSVPEGFGLDQTALIDDRSGPPAGMEQTEPTLVARLTWKGPNGQIIWIESADADGLSVVPTGATRRLDDGTMAQWSDGPGAQRLSWTLPTGQAVTVSGTEVSRARLVAVASNLWFVDRATWDRVTAKAGYVSGDVLHWRIPGEGTSVDLVLNGSLRTGFLLRTGSVGRAFATSLPPCLALAPSDGVHDTDAVVYLAPAWASTVRATGPNGEVVEVPLTTAPGLPSYRWGAAAFPGASDQWINGTDHSKGCTAVAP